MAEISAPNPPSVARPNPTLRVAGCPEHVPAWRGGVRSAVPRASPGGLQRRHPEWVWDRWDKQEVVGFRRYRRFIGFWSMVLYTSPLLFHSEPQPGGAQTSFAQHVETWGPEIGSIQSFCSLSLRPACTSLFQRLAKVLGYMGVVPITFFIFVSDQPIASSNSENIVCIIKF